MPTSEDILALVARLASDPGQGMSASDLARISGWSESHLHRDFRSTTTETPKRWTTRLRLSHATALLCRTQASIAAIARASGFSSHEVLTRTFRRELGTTPSAIRALGVSSQAERAPCLSLYHLSLKPRREPMSTEVTVQRREPQAALVMRRRVTPAQMQQAMAECLPAVFAHCQQHGIQMAGPPFCRYLDMSRGHFSIEAGMPVVAAEDSGEIAAIELPGGDLAIAVHEGPYDTLGDTHSRVEAWVDESDRVAAGPPWESYVTDPGTTPNPADWRTEVILPLV